MATGLYTDDQRAVVTWEQFRDMFDARYIPWVERERSSQEFLSLRRMGVGDGDHPYVHREGDVLPRVCFRVGLDDPFSEHAQD